MLSSRVGNRIRTYVDFYICTVLQTVAYPLGHPDIYSLAEIAGLEPTHRIGYRLLVIFKITALRNYAYISILAEEAGFEPTARF